MILESDIAAKAKAVDDLAEVVGDPETVADANGWLPAERREKALTLTGPEEARRYRTCALALPTSRCSRSP